MPKSVVRSVYNVARQGAGRSKLTWNSRWDVNGSLYGSGVQDRFTYMQAMQMQGTLFAIIQLLSTGAQSTTDWQLFRKDRDGRVRYASSDLGSDQRKEIIRHQALRLWKRPNPFMTGELFREIGWQHMELVGEWYWVLNRGPKGTSIPIEMWPVRPDRMTPVPDPKKYLAGWVYTGPNGEAVPLLPSEVIQLRYPHPTDFYRGLSAVQALLSDIDAAKYSADWSRNFFLNSAQPGGIVTFAKRLSDDEFTEFTDRWREQHQGVARGHRVGVLEQGATWTPNTYSLRDMQFPELRRITSDMIRQGYRIHQAMLGNSDDVNRANAQTAEEVHVAWHEIPRCKRLRTVLNNPYLEMFGDDEVAEFDFKDPSPVSANDANEELTAKSKAAALLVGAGWDAADVLEMVGLPEMRWNANMVVTGGSQTGQNDYGNEGTPDLGQNLLRVKAPRPSVTLSRTDNGKKDVKARVYEQLSEDYPLDAMLWILDAEWSGPVDVPIDHINPEMKWMDEADPNHVQDFVDRLQSGKKLKPVILVNVPGGDLLELADGHHRYLASKQEGDCVRAFIATVDKKHGDWETMHSKQNPRPQNRLEFDMDLGAVLREAFDLAKSNGHQKELVQ